MKIMKVLILTADDEPDITNLKSWINQARAFFLTDLEELKPFGPIWTPGQVITIEKLREARSSVDKAIVRIIGSEIPIGKDDDLRSQYMNNLAEAVRLLAKWTDALQHAS